MFSLFFTWRKQILLLVFGIVAASFIYLLAHNSSCEAITADQLPLQFDGTVVAKRKPPMSHDSFYIDLLDHGKPISYLVEKSGAESEFWQSVSLGERVAKSNNSLLFTIYKQDGSKSTHTFSCSGPN